VNFVAVRHDDVAPLATQTQSLFVNGALASEGASTNSALVFAPLKLAIGADILNDSSRPNFKGDVAEIVVYNRALTVAEIEQASSYVLSKHPAP